MQFRENYHNFWRSKNPILSPHSISLPEGYKLTGKSNDSCMVSFNNSDGFGSLETILSQT